MKFRGGVLIAVLGAAAVLVAVKVLPIDFAFTQFNEDLHLHASIISVGPRTTDQLGDAFYRDALLEPLGYLLSRSCQNTSPRISPFRLQFLSTSPLLRS